ncbi:GNAT family N-acetyltransferase [Paenibacillus sp. GCM10023248]|uniref:GNAT family N-acetyltransferase n=1 Tax=Bacillales TaxID=1385 RepID=UPI0023781D8D|nr:MULTISPECIES: GNAT family N-acetyltransferase [Bacillales]MDD9272269.1 GNAT family N-acetyltransferase [Paenibacillus sp. MAHUQ-63]MDR6885394.1 GNAT superfamily N-acetyltransferase [Bacillus sp. 3255]
MRIQPLSLQTNEDILHLLALQLASYRVEAELIGFDDIPPLKDGIQSIREADETFYGYYVQEENEAEEGKLVGAISFSREGCVVTICRMMVHPNFFRRGIARALLEHILQEQEHAGAQLFIVSTGTANAPAIQLYENFGFAAKRVFTVPPGVSLTTFERPTATR